MLDLFYFSVSPLRKTELKEGLYTKREISPNYTLFWRILPDTQEIEMAMKVKGGKISKSVFNLAQSSKTWTNVLGSSSIWTCWILKICFDFCRKQQQIFNIQNSTCPNQKLPTLTFQPKLKPVGLVIYVLGISSIWLFWIFVLIFFSTAPACRKQQQVFDIQNLTHPNRWAAENIGSIFLRIWPN